MDGKKDVWTIVWYDKDTDSVALADTVDNLDDLVEFLSALQNSKVALLDITVFPPDSNVTYTQILNKALAEKGSCHGQ